MVLPHLSALCMRVHPTCICSELQDEAPHSSRPPAPAWPAAPFREPKLLQNFWQLAGPCTLRLLCLTLSCGTRRSKGSSRALATISHMYSVQHVQSPSLTMPYNFSPWQKCSACA